MGVHGLLHRLTEIGPQVIAIRDLPGLRCSDTCAFHVTAGPVPTDHLHLGMVAEPGGEIAPFVEMQWTVGGHVDQRCAVVATRAESTIVDAEDLHLADLGLGHGPDQSEQGVLAHGDASHGGVRAPARPPGRSTGISRRRARRCPTTRCTDNTQGENPEDDLPADLEDNRDVHYTALGQPQDSGEFITALQDKLRTSLDRFETALAEGTTGGVSIVRSTASRGSRSPRAGSRKSRSLWWRSRGRCRLH